MDKLTPIPTSPSVYWRNVRMRVVPLIVFLGMVALITWRWRYLDGGGVAGIAEGVRSVIACPQPGVLEELRTQPYEWVEAGQVVATLRPVDPRAKLDLLQSQLQIARLQLEPTLADQNALDFERLRLEHLRLKQDLAIAEVEFQRSDSALRRNKVLRDEQLVSEAAYELALRDRDMHQVQINELKRSVAAAESRLLALRGMGEPGPAGTNTVGGALLAELGTKIFDAEQAWKPIELRAPISGMVQIINRQPGEYMMDGEPFMAINSDRADRIVAFLRQPYPVEPEPGMKVEVVTRSRRRGKFLAEVWQVGVQVEVITNALAVMRPFATLDVGLPVVVKVPRGVQVRPGELCDIRFLPSFTPRSEALPAASRARPRIEKKIGSVDPRPQNRALAGL